MYPNGTNVRVIVYVPGFMYGLVKAPEVDARALLIFNTGSLVATRFTHQY